MSKFYNLEGQSVVVEAALEELHSVNEGWADLFGALASTIAGGVAGIFTAYKIGEKTGSSGLGAVLSHLFAAMGCIGGFVGYYILTGNKLQKIAEHPEVQKYLLEKAKEIFKEAKKKDKSLISKYEFMEKDLVELAEKGELEADPESITAGLKYMRSADVEIGEFRFLFFGDTSEIKRIVMPLYSKEFNRLTLKDIPVPSKEEIKAMLSTVKESMEVATEGWGAAFAKMLGFSAIGIPLSAIATKLQLKILTNPDDDFKTMAKKSVAAGVGGLILNIALDIAANKAIDLQASKKLLEALNKPEMVEHIKTEAAKAFKELKKEHKSLTVDVENALKEKAHSKEASKDERGFIAKFMTYYAKCTAKIDKYTVFATGDFKSFDSLYVIFFDEEEGKIVRKALPIPSVKAEEAPAE